jgi:hypothetical protein
VNCPGFDADHLQQTQYGSRSPTTSACSRLDQGRSSAFMPLPSCRTIQFLGRKAIAPVTGAMTLTVAVRWAPDLAGRCGTLVAWPTRTKAARRAALAASSRDGCRRSFPVTNCVVGKLLRVAELRSPCPPGRRRAAPGSLPAQPLKDEADTEQQPPTGPPAAPRLVARAALAPSHVAAAGQHAYPVMTCALLGADRLPAASTALAVIVLDPAWWSFSVPHTPESVPRSMSVPR